GDVQHREEDPVVEERGPQVVRRDEDEHAAAPDEEQRPDVLQPSLREHLALLAQVRGEEDDQEDLRELARLELRRADAHPQARAVHRLTEPGYAGQEEQRDRGHAEQVLVVLEDAVVAAESDQRECEQRDPDHDPEALLERVGRTGAIDLGHADGGQQSGQRQEVGVGVRDGEPRDHVRCQVEREEEEGVAERAPADERLACDVHRRESEPREDADGGEVQELAVAGPKGDQRASPHQTSTTIAATSTRMTASASSLLAMPASWVPACGACASCSASAARTSAAGTTMVSCAA